MHAVRPSPECRKRFVFHEIDSAGVLIVAVSPPPWLSKWLSNPELEFRQWNQVQSVFTPDPDANCAKAAVFEVDGHLC
jgi:hypothetical protein